MTMTRPDRGTPARPTALLLSVALLLFVSAGAAGAADISVNPVRIFLQKGEQTGTISVVNHSEEDFAIQISVMAWDQDDSGADRYEPADEIVVFPRLVNLPGKAEQLVRLGVRVPPGTVEKTYRVYVEEIPKPNRNPKDATYLRTYLRIGVPVFVQPLEPAASGAIQEGRMETDRFSFRVTNTGNLHFMIREIRVTGESGEGATEFEKNLSGWYLLAGRSRGRSVGIPADLCPKLKTVRVSVLADKLQLEQAFDVPPGSCAR